MIRKKYTRLSKLSIINPKVGDIFDKFKTIVEIIPDYRLNLIRVTKTKNGDFITEEELKDMQEVYQSEKDSTTGEFKVKYLLNKPTQDNFDTEVNKVYDLLRPLMKYNDLVQINRKHVEKDDNDLIYKLLEEKVYSET